MYDIQNKTCVRIVKRIPEKHKNYIFVFDGGDKKCQSALGKRGGKQDLKLAPGCMAVRKKCIHEMLHALGFHHMVKTPLSDPFFFFVNNILFY